MTAAAIAGPGAFPRRVARDAIEAGWNVTLVDPKPGRVQSFLDNSGLQAGIVAALPGTSEFLEAINSCEVLVSAGSEVEAEVELARAAIAAGVGFVSSSHSVESYDAIAELGEAAQEAGVPIVWGMGWSPGITNVLAGAAAERAGSAHQVHVRWAASISGSAGSALLDRVFESFAGNAVTYRGGSWRREEAGTDEERVFFPEPVSWCETGLCPGSEVMSVPRYFPGLEEVTVKCGVSERALAAVVQRFGEWSGHASARGKARLVTLARRLTPVSALSGNSRTWTAVRVDAEGAEGRVSLGVVDQAENMGAAALLTAAELIKSVRPGFQTAEALDPAAFFTGLRSRGVRPAVLQAIDR